MIAALALLIPFLLLSLIADYCDQHPKEEA